MLLASAVVLVTVVASMRSAVAAAERPNIVLVLTDDLTKKDYFDLGGNLSSFTSGGTLGLSASFQRRTAFDETLLTFCPPGPPERA